MRNIHLLFLCVLFFLGSCSDEDRNPISNEDIYLNLYYSHNGESQQILQGDTITASLGDTIKFSVDVTADTFIGLYGDKNIEIIKEDIEGKESYVCIIKKAGVASVGAYAYDYKTSTDFLIDFVISTPSVSYTILVVSEPEILINASENEKKDIQTKLAQDLYIPNFYSYYQLNANSIIGGEVLYKTASKDTVSGIFTSSDASLLNDMVIYLDNATYNFTIEKATDSNYVNGYLFKLDFTDSFKTMYPNGNIQNVIVTFLAIKNKK